jgi:hypothetical protein
LAEKILTMFRTPPKPLIRQNPRPNLSSGCRKQPRRRPSIRLEGPDPAILADQSGPASDGSGSRLDRSFVDRSGDRSRSRLIGERAPRAFSPFFVFSRLSPSRRPPPALDAAFPPAPSGEVAKDSPRAVVCGRSNQKENNQQQKTSNNTATPNVQQSLQACYLEATVLCLAQGMYPERFKRARPMGGRGWAPDPATGQWRTRGGHDRRD